MIALNIHLGEGLRDAPDEDVLRLEVPVDDVVLVEVLEGPADLQHDQLDHLGSQLVTGPEYLLPVVTSCDHIPSIW